MKKILLILCAAALTAGCANEAEKKAQAQLEEARKAYELGRYETAKQLLDSLHARYPKAFDARKAGQALERQVEQDIQRRRLVTLDSLLAVRQREVDSLLPRYTFEKDAEYQNVGNYFWPTQTVEKNLHRSHLRFQTDETGKTSLTSIYCGSSFIHHTGVKVTAPDGSFAETPPSKDSYQTRNNGEKIEKADYKQEEDGGVTAFLIRQSGKTIRLTFTGGERTYTTTMQPADLQAAEAIHRLGELLNSITRIKKEQEAARLKIEFIRRKTERQNATDATSPAD